MCSSSGGSAARRRRRVLDVAGGDGPRQDRLAGGFSTAPDLPAGFPRECAPVGNDAFGRGYFTLAGGDVQITDAK